MTLVDSEYLSVLGLLRPMAPRASSSPTGTAAVAARLRLTREALGMTQAELSRKVGLTPQAWNNCERGVNRISLDLAIRVCATTGATLDWIYRDIMSTLPLSMASKIIELREKAEPRKRA